MQSAEYNCIVQYSRFNFLTLHWRAADFIVIIKKIYLTGTTIIYNYFLLIEIWRWILKQKKVISAMTDIYIDTGGCAKKITGHILPYITVPIHEL